ncbi:Hypothetical predicted protein [Paramuricea clavata]|uniref:Uncharacterized protein n=1 Tax=Paramuricea clavata TaxID=317549 RepID=A0A7D9EWH7_PARCT|nr:Hypothetical predicted protein [Paramuricea clavata]
MKKEVKKKKEYEKRSLITALKLLQADSNSDLEKRCQDEPGLGDETIQANPPSSDQPPNQPANKEKRRKKRKSKKSKPNVPDLTADHSTDVAAAPSEVAVSATSETATSATSEATKIPYIGNGGTHFDYLPSQSNDNFRLNTTSPSVVGTLLSKPCKSKAAGLDKISARLLCDCSDLIADSICAIFNCSINFGTFPNEWKCSKVIPLFKKGERRDLNNYRPISIIPVVAKVFERIIYDQVYAYLMDNNLLSNCQSGFRTLHSTVTALLEATNNWSYNIDRGNVNAVVFLDLKKAFDTVDHAILLSKLSVYGLGGSTGNWFRSYLNDRNQKCYVNGHLSGQRVLPCGIPQGTILGPLLFLIYINDLQNCLTHSHPRMYADDTNLTFASNNVDDMDYKLNEDLDNVNKWLIANKLTLMQSM